MVKFAAGILLFMVFAVLRTLSIDQNYDADQENFKGVQVLNEGLEEFQADKVAFLKELEAQLQDPEITLPGPLNDARRALYDFESWPEDLRSNP